jgi:hypothetical protein
MLQPLRARIQPGAPYPKAKMKPETEPNVETKSGRRPDASCLNAKMWPGIELNVATKHNLLWNLPLTSSSLPEIWLDRTRAADERSIVKVVRSSKVWAEMLCTFIVATQSKGQRQVLLYDFFFQKGKDVS